ncbi:Uncharacterised protein [Mycobacteroides abscessus subsp. abscessus]|nr:Uncharacterised protein [Mycobacteroides abscessus subsp. abscessus]
MHWPGTRSVAVAEGSTTRMPRVMSAMSPYLSDWLPEERVATHPPTVDHRNESGK